MVLCVYVGVCLSVMDKFLEQGAEVLQCSVCKFVYLLEMIGNPL